MFALKGIGSPKSIFFDGNFSQLNFLFSNRFNEFVSLVVQTRVSGFENSKLLVIGCLNSVSAVGKGGISLLSAHAANKIIPKIIGMNIFLFVIIFFMISYSLVD